MLASGPRWPDELPENMTEAEYLALAEDISRSVEIVHGHVIKCESPVPPAQPDRPASLFRAGVRAFAIRPMPDYRDDLLDELYDVIEIREFHLDAATSAYRLHAVHRSVLDLEQPVRLTLPIFELVTG